MVHGDHPRVRHDVGASISLCPAPSHGCSSWGNSSWGAGHSSLHTFTADLTTCPLLFLAHLVGLATQSLLSLLRSSFQLCENSFHSELQVYPYSHGSLSPLVLWNWRLYYQDLTLYLLSSLRSNIPKAVSSPARFSCLLSSSLSSGMQTPYAHLQTTFWRW